MRPEYGLAASVDHIWIYALIALFGGLYVSYRGFRMLQRKRLILNTPTSKIRSASLGLVELSGLAVGPYTLTAPVTSRPCFYYRTLAWELRRSGKNQEWKQVANESLHVPFYLDDNTGKVLINPQGADLDLHRDFHEEFSNSMFISRDMPDTVRMFLARHGVAGDHKIRVDEYCIKPKNALFILGTLAENTGAEISSQPIVSEQTHLAKFDFNVPNGLASLAVSLGRSTPDTSKPGFTFTHQEVIRLTPEGANEFSPGTSQQSKIAAALTKAGITNPAAWAAAGIGGPVMTNSSSRSAAGAAPAAQNTSAEFNLKPDVVLKKGENDPTFLISWRSQRDVVRSLGWKSAACIWGGPVLTLLGLYLLMVGMTWL